MKEYYVYMYIDPETNIPFYVGKGCNRRYSDIHGHRYNTHLYNKIQKIRRDKQCHVKYFTKFVYTNITSEEALSHEIRLIKELGRKHIHTGPLLNLTEGGDGVRNPIKKITNIVNDKTNFVKLVNKKYTIKQLAKHYNCGTTLITNVCKILKIGTKGRRVYLPEKDIIALYNKKKSISYICNIYKCDRCVIIRILSNNNINIEDGRKKSVFRGGKKLSKLDHIKDNIIEMYKNNLSIYKISRIYNCDSCVIKSLLKNNDITIIDSRKKEFKK